VAVVIGAAFGAVVTSLVTNILTPLIAAIFGKPDFSALNFTFEWRRISYGIFLNALIGFLLVARRLLLMIAPMMPGSPGARNAYRPIPPAEKPGMPERRSHHRATLRNFGSQLINATAPRTLKSGAQSRGRHSAG